ncbi:MAG: hypothetical protein MUF76_12285, partial [Hydrogenophaga sp.]|nr:hypothetical protein [Hydrogenophaga sp.]
MTSNTPPQSRPAPARRGWRWLLWVPLGALAALLLAVAAAWTWAGTPGSLALALRWVQGWAQNNSASVGQIELQQVQGSLRAGGAVDELRWSHNGLAVTAEDVRLDLGDAFWINILLGRGINPGGLSVDKLQVNDQRPPSTASSEPLQSFTLPLPVSLPW